MAGVYSDMDVDDDGPGVHVDNMGAGPGIFELPVAAPPGQSYQWNA